jgi:hypothetical protein
MRRIPVEDGSAVEPQFPLGELTRTILWIKANGTKIGLRLTEMAPSTPFQYVVNQVAGHMEQPAENIVLRRGSGGRTLDPRLELKSEPGVWIDPEIHADSRAPSASASSVAGTVSNPDTLALQLSDMSIDVELTRTQQALGHSKSHPVVRAQASAQSIVSYTFEIPEDRYGRAYTFHMTHHVGRIEHHELYVKRKLLGCYALLADLNCDDAVGVVWIAFNCINFQRTNSSSSSAKRHEVLQPNPPHGSEKLRAASMPRFKMLSTSSRRSTSTCLLIILSQCNPCTQLLPGGKLLL